MELCAIREHWNINRKNVCKKGMLYTFIVLEHTLKQPNCIPQRICTALSTWHSILTATTNKYCKLMLFQYRNEKKKKTQKSVPNKFLIDILSVCTYLCCTIFKLYCSLQQTLERLIRYTFTYIEYFIVFDVLFTFISLMLLTSKYFLLAVA